MKSVEYIAALSIGLIIGWVAQTLLNSPADSIGSQPASALSTSPEIEAQDLQANAAVATTQQSPAVTPEKNEQSSGWTAAGLIDAVHAMDESGFRDFSGAVIDRKTQLSKTLIEGLLGDLLSISDPLTRHRIIELLGSSRFTDFNQKGFDSQGIEDWVMAKVRSGEQSSQWLDVLSYWGVQGEEHTTFLADSLDSHYEAAPRVSTMLALAKGFGVRVYADDDAKAEITALIEPYLDSENDLERAAAIRAQNNYPGKDYADRLTTALDDPSEKVRINAALAMMSGQRLNSDAIKDTLVKNMQSLSASAQERLTSYGVLQTLPLEGKHYQAVYDFRIHSAYRLEKQDKQERQSEYSPW